LKELLQTTHTIYTITRCSTNESPLARLQHELSNLKIWDSLQDHKDRIIPLAGNIELPSFGLPESEFKELTQKIGILLPNSLILLISLLDVVYHCAAVVNHILPYNTLRQQNVVATNNILTFCIVKPARLNYVSTVSSVPNVIPGSSYGDIMR
jgi:thioester reductase-like protein